MAQKTPRVIVRQAADSKWGLVVNGEVRLTADSIFEKKISDSGKRIVAVYQEKDAIKLFVITLDPPMEENFILNPCPSPGFAVRLIVEKEGKNFTLHYRSENEFYILRYFFVSIKTDGPFDKATAAHFLEVDMSRQL